MSMLQVASVCEDAPAVPASSSARSSSKLMWQGLSDEEQALSEILLTFKNEPVTQDFEQQEPQEHHHDPQEQQQGQHHQLQQAISLVGAGASWPGTSSLSSSMMMSTMATTSTMTSMGYMTNSSSAMDTASLTNAVQMMKLPSNNRITAANLGGMYRSKMDLTVNMPNADLNNFTTVSPVASSLYPGHGGPMVAPSHSPSERSKRYGPVVQLEDLRKCFNMPIAAVARKFGICATLLKKVCRRYGIQRWPHRQIRSLQKSIDMLKESLVVAKGSNREYIAKKIAAFECTLDCIMKDPNTAAKGISAGRLASPSSEELIKRGNRAKCKRRSSSPLDTDHVANTHESVDMDAEEPEPEPEDEQEEPVTMAESSYEPAAGSFTTSSPSNNHHPSSSPSMSLKSILC